MIWAWLCVLNQTTQSWRWQSDWKTPLWSLCMCFRCFIMIWYCKEDIRKPTRLAQCQMFSCVDVDPWQWCFLWLIPWVKISISDVFLLYFVVVPFLSFSVFLIILPYLCVFLQIYLHLSQSVYKVFFSPSLFFDFYLTQTRPLFTCSVLHLLAFPFLSVKIFFLVIEMSLSEIITLWTKNSTQLATTF